MRARPGADLATVRTASRVVIQLVGIFSRAAMPIYSASVAIDNQRSRDIIDGIMRLLLLFLLLSLLLFLLLSLLLFLLLSLPLSYILCAPCALTYALIVVWLDL